MEKNELLLKLQEAIRTEESASAIFLEHLHALAERSGIDEHLAGNTRQVLETLIRENNRHRNILETMRERVKGEERDDW